MPVFSHKTLYIMVYIHVLFVSRPLSTRGKYRLGIYIYIYIYSCIHALLYMSLSSVSNDIVNGTGVRQNQARRTKPGGATRWGRRPDQSMTGGVSVDIVSSWFELKTQLINNQLPDNYARILLIQLIYMKSSFAKRHKRHSKKNGFAMPMPSW